MFQIVNVYRMRIMDTIPSHLLTQIYFIITNIVYNISHLKVF